MDAKRIKNLLTPSRINDLRSTMKRKTPLTTDAEIRSVTNSEDREIIEQSAGTVHNDTLLLVLATAVQFVGHERSSLRMILKRIGADWGACEAMALYQEILGSRKPGVTLTLERLRIYFEGEEVGESRNATSAVNCMRRGNGSGIRRRMARGYGGGAD